MIEEESIKKILSRNQLEEELGIEINQDRLESIINGAPYELHEIAHYAAAWGISDDGYRLDFIKNTDNNLKINLQFIVDRYEDVFDKWLAGPEANGPEFSESYISFSCMRMASDEIFITKS